MEGGGGSRKACARCRAQKKRCEQDCKFAPFFPAHETEKYAKVHEVFGADNVINKLKKLPVNQQKVALECMVYEAKARLQNPVYGCSQVIWALREKVQELERLNLILTAEVKELRALMAVQVQLDQSKLNDHNDNVEPLEVMSEATAPLTATQARPA